MINIAVLSGKGGVGKTTISVNLALFLKKMGFRVGIMDADIDCPNVPQIAGIPVEYQIEIKNDEIIPYNWDGIDVVSLAWTLPEITPILWDDTQKQEAIEQILRLSQWRDLDYLIIDCPAGTGGELYSVLKQKVKGAIIVTTPHAAAVADAKRAIEAVKEYKTPLIGIINNMSYIDVKCVNCGNLQKEIISNKKDWDNKDLLGELPYSRTIIVSNRIELFEPIVNKILKRIPNLKEVEHYSGRVLSIKRKMVKYAIKKTT